MLLVDHLLEAFAGTLKGLNARDPLPEEAATLQALALSQFQP
jgi:hypothetical protein